MPDETSYLPVPPYTRGRPYPEGAQRYGRLVALGRVANGPRGHVRWECQCDCGNRLVCGVSSLSSGNTQSCGCLKQDVLDARSRIHGCAQRGKHTPEYRAWSQAINRVTNPNCPNYERYGGRGITMAPEFAASFEAFLAYVGPRPSPKHTLEREDNAKGYERGNLRWATRVTQGRNRDCVKLSMELAREIRDRPESGGALAKVYGVSKTTICRLRRGEIWQEEP